MPVEGSCDQPSSFERVELFIRTEIAALPAPLKLELLAMPRKKNAVQLVVRETSKNAAALEFIGRELRITDENSGALRTAAHPYAHLAPVRQLASNIQP